MKTLRKRKVAKAHGYIYKLSFKSDGERVYLLNNKDARYSALVNYSYTTFEKELSQLLEINKF